MRWLIVSLALSLAACDIGIAPSAAVGLKPAELARALGSEQAMQDFYTVVQAVEPEAERECRRRRPADANCDFLILVDPDINAEPNAFQSEDDSGRPVLTLTVGLIETVRNADELAFVIGHESAHHISNHLARQRSNIQATAETFGGLATLTGGDDDDVKAAQELGAIVGVKAYSKSFELEADELGTIITYHAGYDPLIGAAFFTRIPDPGDQFLGSHPPNEARIRIVEQTVERLRK